MNEIKFSCKRCGNCCRVSGFVHISKTEAKKIAEFLKLDFLEFKKIYTEWILFAGRVLKGGKISSCIFLKDNFCLIYPVRPEQCRTFPYWKNILNDESELKYVKEYCAGIE